MANMVNVFVGANSVFTAADNEVVVKGAAGGAEKLRVLGGVTGVQADGNFERIEVAGNLADHKFVFVAGTGVQIQTAAGVVVATVPSLNQAATVAFADGSAPLVQAGATNFTLGGQAISSTAAAITSASMGTSFNAQDQSQVPDGNPVDTGIPTLKTAVASGTEVILNFSEALEEIPAITGTAAAALFTVTGTTAAGLTFAVPVNSVIVAGSKVTLGLGSSTTFEALGAATVNVSYTGNVLKDLSGNAAANIPATGAIIGADGAPELKSSFPAADGVLLDLNGDLTFTFNEPVTLAGVADAITLKKGATTVPSTVSLSADGQTLTINPTGALEAGTDYTVKFAAGAVLDLTGNALVTVPQNFKTTANIADTAAVTSFDASGAPVFTETDTVKLLVAPGKPATLQLVNTDTPAVPTVVQQQAAKNTGADTVALPELPANAKLAVQNFTTGTNASEADKLQLAGYTSLNNLIENVQSITVAESGSAFAMLFKGDPAKNIAPKQFLDFTVTLKNGAEVLLLDLIALDALAANVKALLPTAAFTDTPEDHATALSTLTFSAGVTADAKDVDGAAGTAAIAILVGSLEANLEFGA